MVQTKRWTSARGLHALKAADAYLGSYDTSLEQYLRSIVIHVSRKRDSGVMRVEWEAAGSWAGGRKI